MKKSSAAPSASADASTPADLVFDCQPFDVAFHPRADVLAPHAYEGARGRAPDDRGEGGGGDGGKGGGGSGTAD